MRIWRSLEEVPAGLGRTVVVIGNFDGVHLGHRHVVSRARAVGDERGLHVVAATFDPHPMAVLRPEHAPLPLSTLEQRCELLAEAGVDDVFVIPFSREIAAWSPEEFVDRVLVEGLHADAVVVGANFRFGNKAAGDVSRLVALGRERGFTVDGLDLEGGPQVWSSTYVRTCLAAGDVEGAAEALGRPYTVLGEVVRGERRGRELGYPTANLATGEVLIPADGVYAGWLCLLDELNTHQMPAAISVGTNPTFAGERQRRVEAYVLDQEGLDLYDRRVEVSFVAHIREVHRFAAVEELVAAMAGDVARTRELLGLPG